MPQYSSSVPLPFASTEKMDLQADEASFPRIEQLLSDQPDICRVQPLRRQHDTYILNHPDLIRHVLLTRRDNYIKGVGFERVKLILGNGIIVSDGEFWQGQRRMVQPAFHQRMLDSLGDMMKALSRQWLAQWKEIAERGESIELTSSMSEFALEIMLRSLFSDDLDALNKQAGGNPFDIFTAQHERDLNLALRFRELMKLIQALVERRRSAPALPPDMLSVLMSARDANDRPMSDKALMDELMTLIVAGHETSAITLTWMWYLLAGHPEAEERLLAEVDGLETQDSGLPDLNAMVYCRQVMNETLRLYPPVWLFSRRALENDTIRDWQIPAGADILISPYFLHRREDYWPQPEKFDPARFGTDIENSRYSTAFIPFSAGRRKCIGDVFALQEIRVHFATIAREIVLKRAAEEPVVLEPEINMRSKNPIRMYPRFRQSI